MSSRLLHKPGSAAAILLLGSLVGLSACGGSVPSGSPSMPSASPTSSSPTTIPPTAPTATVTSSASTTMGSDEVAAAVTAALSLYSRSATNLDDPSAGYVWSATATGKSLSIRLRERLAWLTAHDYFSDMNCGENYIDGNQVGLTRAPKAVSVTPNHDGTVTVVIRGYLNSAYRDLVVVMSQGDGSWLATDLRRGEGPDASVFSDRPNC
jgi:hypothetical protein